MASKRVLSSSAELFYDTTPALTVKSILAQADKVYRNSQIKETEWHNQLKLSEAKAHETIHEEIQRTGSCLKLWEDLFKKETSTLFASSKNAVAQRVAEIKALQDSLAKNMIMVEVWLQNSSKQESFPLQEVIKLLQETSILQEKLRNEELLPNVSLRRAISLTEGSLRHKFWYLVTHDVLPHDVMLQGPSVFKLGLTVFVIQIPSKVNREEVLSLLKCTVEVEGSEPQELRLEWQDDIASIAVDVTQLCIHSISVFLYHQHVCGSPLRFFPSQSLPSKTEETKSRNHINASQQVVESPDSSSLSDDDYMMDKQSFQKRRQNLAGRSLNLLNRHLMKAADQRKNDSSLMDRETKNLVHPVENSVKSKSYMIENTCNVDANASLGTRNPAIGVAKLIKNENTAGETKDFSVSPEVTRKVSGCLKDKGLKTPEAVLPEINLTGKKAFRKAMVLTKPQRRPRLPAVLSNVPGVFVYNEADNSMRETNSDGLKSDPKGTGLKAADETPRVKYPIANVPVNCISDGNTSHLNKDDGNKAPNQHSTSDESTADICFAECELRHVRFPDICSKREYDCSTARFDDNFNYILAKVNKFAIDSSCRRKDIVSDVQRKDMASAPVMSKYENEPSVQQLKKMIIVDQREEEGKAGKTFKTQQNNLKIRNLVSDLTKKEQVKVVKMAKEKEDLKPKMYYKDFAVKEEELRKARMQEERPEPDFNEKLASHLENTDQEHHPSIPIGLSGKLIKKSYAPSDNPLFKPIGVAELHDGSVAVTDTFNNRLALFSASGIFLRYLDSVHMQRPSAIVVFKNGNFAVKDNRSIVIFTEKSKFLRTLSTPLKRPYGLTLLEDGNLMTVETTSYGYVTLVTIDSSSDSEVSRVKVDLCLPKQCHRVSKPRFITYHRDGRLLVVDLGLHCIYVVDINQGTLVSVFGEEGVKEGQLRDPSGILSDSEGYIVVGDSRNHRIQVFDPYGQFLCVLETDTPLNRPSGISLTSAGELLVINYWDNSLARYHLTC